MDGPGGDEIFRPSRPALGPTQPPVIWVPGLSRGKVRSWRAADHSPPSSAAVMEEYSYTSTHSLGHTGPVTGSAYFTFHDNLAYCRIVLKVVEKIKIYFIFPNYFFPENFAV